MIAFINGPFSLPSSDMEDNNGRTRTLYNRVRVDVPLDQPPFGRLPASIREMYPANCGHTAETIWSDYSDVSVGPSEISEIGESFYYVLELLHLLIASSFRAAPIYISLDLELACRLIV
jgi:hypothetical protein